jgi:hypothetical protein
MTLDARPRFKLRVTVEENGVHLVTAILYDFVYPRSSISAILECTLQSRDVEKETYTKYSRSESQALRTQAYQGFIRESAIRNWSS